MCSASDDGALLQLARDDWWFVEDNFSRTFGAHFDFQGDSKVQVALCQCSLGGDSESSSICSDPVIEFYEMMRQKQDPRENYTAVSNVNQFMLLDLFPVVLVERNKDPNLFFNF